jgi:hypothetical protein
VSGVPEASLKKYLRAITLELREEAVPEDCHWSFSPTSPPLTPSKPDTDGVGHDTEDDTHDRHGASMSRYIASRAHENNVFRVR